MIPGSASLQVAQTAQSGADAQTDASTRTGGGNRSSPVYQITTGGSNSSSAGLGLGADNSVLWIAAAALGVILYLRR